MAEGNQYGLLLKLIKEQGYNKDINMGIGEVISASPFKLDYKGLVFEDEDIEKTETSVSRTYAVEDKVLIMIDGDQIYLIDKMSDESL